MSPIIPLMGRVNVVASMLAFGLVACAQQPQGVMMNQFIPDQKLAAVRVCETTGEKLIASLGKPSGAGRDADMATLSWNAAGMLHASDSTTIGTQMVSAWVDSDGFVAGFVVNPASVPTKPPPCREQRPAAAPEDAAPLPPKSKTEA